MSSQNSAQASRVPMPSMVIAVHSFNLTRFLSCWRPAARRLGARAAPPGSVAPLSTRMRGARWPRREDLALAARDAHVPECLEIVKQRPESCTIGGCQVRRFQPFEVALQVAQGPREIDVAARRVVHCSSTILPTDNGGLKNSTQ